MATYLKQIKGRNGYYFQRAVPKDLQGRLGHLWKRKAADTRTEATREALRLLGVTDRIIDVCRADPQTIIKFNDVAQIDTSFVSDFGDNDPIDAYDVIDNRFIHRKEIRYDVKHDWQLLIDEIVKRNPEQPHHTVRQWRSECKLFVKQTNCASVDQLTHDLVDEYVLHLRDTCNKQSTLKTKWGRLKSLNEYAMAYRWTNELFFNKEKLKGVKIKEHARGTIEEEKCLDIAPADDFFRLAILGTHTKNFDQYIRTHWVMRYTLAHVSEAEGIVWEDIDMDARTISIQANELRELKTDQRGRKLPMIDPLFNIIKDMYDSSHTRTGSIFNLKPTNDWGNNVRRYYRNIQGHFTPKSCRHYGSGVIQSIHGDQDRRVKYIHGHGKKGETSTAQYGDISTDSLKPYLELLM